jgi:Kef-type K+ transport system membrane component KefB
MPVDDFHFAPTLATIVAVIIATKVAGAIAQRFGQPTVLGELLAGVVLGVSVLGIVVPTDTVIHTIAELGVLILLFEIGLHVDLRALVRVWRAASAVGIAGVVLSFLGGFAAAGLMGTATLPAVLCGAALTATSIGISARVLSDLGSLHTPEGRVILGAAVLDDILGLIILSVVAGLAVGEALTAEMLAWKTLVAFGFIAAALVLGRLLAPPVFRFIERIEVAGTLGLFGLAFAFALAWLAEAVGSAMIIGAFAAGLVLHHTPQRSMVERATTEIGHFFVPFFFAFVGASVDVRAFADADILLIGGALIVAGVVGKYVSGYAAWGFSGDKRVIGAAMIPRGEVGLIFAQMGLTRGILTVPLFSALTLMVMVTTLIAPPLLKHLIGRVRPPDAEFGPGTRGVDDLVAGTDRRLAEPTP